MEGLRAFLDKVREYRQKPWAVPAQGGDDAGTVLLSWPAAVPELRRRERGSRRRGKRRKETAQNE
jgi:hypothetical protein